VASIINEYDEMNRRIRVTDPDGNITRIFYDNSGNVVKYVDPENYDNGKRRRSRYHIPFMTQ